TAPSGATMDFTITCDQPQHIDTQCLIATLGADGALGPAAAAINEASDGYTQSIIDAGDMKGGKGETMLLHIVPGISDKRVLLLRLGSDDDRTDAQYDKNLLADMATVKSSRCTDAVFCIDEDAVSERDCYWRTRKIVETVSYSLYSYDETK